MTTVVQTMALGGPNMYIPNGGSTLMVPQIPAIVPYRKRPIAPAPMSSASGSPQPTTVMLKDRPLISKKYCALPYSVTPQQSASIQRRNARERNRVKQVNNGFANLRQHIPSTVVTALTNGGRGPHKKLSKVDTLRVALKYIRSLQRMLAEDIENSGEPSKSDPQALSPASYYGSMSDISTSSSPAPSQLSEYSSYSSSQPETISFKREPYDPYSTGLTSSPAPAPVTTPTTTQLPSMTSFTTTSVSGTTYSQPIHHVYKAHHHHHHQLMGGGGYHGQHEELSPQSNTEDEELLDAISWWQQQQ